MNFSDSPRKQSVPFAINGQREEILATTPAGDNTASYDSGFPPVTMILKAAGGKPPKGQDMNQILYELSSLSRWFSAGALNAFDSSFSTAVGGYPKGAVLINDTASNIFISTIDANTNNPNSVSTGWLGLLSFLGGAPLESPALTGIPTAPTAATGTSNTQIASTAFVQTLINNTIGSGALTSSASWNFSVGVNISGTLRKVIFQGGTRSDSGSGARNLSVSFPVVFPNAVLDMHANDIGAAAYPLGTAWTSTSSGNIYVPAYSVGTSSTPQATSNLTVRWFAIGY